MHLPDVCIVEKPVTQTSRKYLKVLQEIAYSTGRKMLTNYRTNPQQNLWLDELAKALAHANYNAQQIRRAA
jgi:hypothetical protein